MGIRIHKFLGYGLTDLEPGEDCHWRADPRVNWDSPLLEDKITGKDYFRWLEQRREADSERFRFSMDWAMLRNGEHEDEDLWSCVAYSPEYGLPEVLALRPLASRDWSRYDDSIDYMEETYPWSDETSQRNRVKVYEHGPFPFNGFYMDRRDGRRLPQDIMRWWRLRNTTPGNKEAEQFLDAFATACGFAGHEEAVENVAPEVPEEIRDIAEFTRLFTSETVWLQLRPLLYTYWS